MQNVTGRRIKQLRTARAPRMTQADLARSLQLRGLRIDRAGVAKIEGGFRQVSDVELLLIADALEVAPADLLPESGADQS